MQTSLEEKKGKAVRSEIVQNYEKKGVSEEKAEEIAGAVAGEEHRAKLHKHRQLVVA